MKALSRLRRSARLLGLIVPGLLSFAPDIQAQQSYSLTPLWSLAPETPYEWVSTNALQRGMAFNPTTGNLLTVSRHPATNAAVYLLNSANGTHVGNLDVSGVFAEINFPLNMIGVAQDGVIYACNLTVDSTNAPTGNNGPFRIYRWQNESASPTVAYIGDPSEEDPLASHRRFGDSIAVRGSGVNTEILTGTRNGKILARFTTSDGINFTHQKISAPDLVGAVNTMTISYGAGNTFWIKAESTVNTNYPLQHFSYDVTSGTATLIRNYTNSPVTGGPLAFDLSRNLLGIIRGRSNEFNLFKLTDYGFVRQEEPKPFLTSYTNGNFTGSVVFTQDRLFVLSTHNGILAFSINTNTLPPFSTSASVSGGNATLNWPSASRYIYQAQYKDSLNDAQWLNLHSPTNGTGATISLDDVVTGTTRFYRIDAQ